MFIDSNASCLFILNSKTRSSPFRLESCRSPLTSVIGSFLSPLSSLLEFNGKGVHWDRSKYSVIAESKQLLSSGKSTPSLDSISAVQLTSELEAFLSLHGVSAEEYAYTLSRYEFFTVGGGGPSDEDLAKPFEFKFAIPQTFLEEVSEVFRQSQRHASLGYVLLPPGQRSRLGMRFLPVRFSLKSEIRKFPNFKIAPSIDVLGSKFAGRFDRLEKSWDLEFSSLSLFDFSNSEPLELDRFLALQLAARTAVVNKIETWLEKCLKDILNGSEKNRFENAAIGFMDARVCAIIRDLIVSHLQELVNRFESSESIITNKLKIDDDCIKPEMDREEFKKKIKSLFLDTLNCANQISSVKYINGPKTDEMRKTIFAISENSDLVRSLIERFTEIIDDDLCRMDKFVVGINRFSWLLKEVTNSRIIVSQGERGEVQEYVENLRNVYWEMETFFSNCSKKMTQIDFDDVASYLRKIIKESVDVILLNTRERSLKRTKTVEELVNKFEENICKNCTDENILVNGEKYLFDFIQTVRYEIITIHEENKIWFDLSLELFVLEEIDFQNILNSTKSVCHMERLIDTNQIELKDERKKMEDSVKSRNAEFEIECKSFYPLILKIRNFGNVRLADEVWEQISNLSESIKKAEIEAADLLRRQSLLGLQQSEFFILQDASERITPFVKLWGGIEGFRRVNSLWSKSPARSIILDDIQAGLLEYRDLCEKMTIFFELEYACDAVLNVIKQFGSLLDSVEELFPVIRFLSDKRLSEIHWKKLSDILGFPIDADTTYSLAKFIEMGILTQWPAIIEISP